MEKNSNLTPFEKGKSGNPNGRPKGSLNVKTIGEKWLKMKEKVKHPITGEEMKINQLDRFFLTLIKEGRDGNITAIREYLDRVYGKSTQINEITGSEGTPFIPGTMRVVIENPHNDSDGE